MKEKVLVVCIGNSCRSQMAEGFIRARWGELLDVYSAGVRESRVDPLAVQVMGERGIDLSSHSSKCLDHFKGAKFDYLITVCKDGETQCPYVPTNNPPIHRGFDDSPKLTQGMEANKAVLVYRRVCDEIEEFVASLPEVLGLAHLEVA